MMNRTGDIKAGIEESRAVRKELQMEIGDVLFDGADFSVKREDRVMSSGADAGSDGGRSKKRKPKRTYNN
jgi:hypothetical protein